jgi:WD40 repeat protein
MWCVQAKAQGRGRKLVGYSMWENRVVIHDLDTRDQKASEVTLPVSCSASHHFIAIITYGAGMHLLSNEGDIVHIVPDSVEAYRVAFHPHYPSILAIACGDGTVRMWHTSTQAYLATFKQHRGGMSSIRFTPDCRLFLSSWDKTASIVTLDAQFQYLSSVKLKGHSGCVNDILPLSSLNKCVTCSGDKTIKVWDYQTGACLRTLTEHTNRVMSLAMHSNGQYFASGSEDRTVIIWSSETFEVLRRFTFPNIVQFVLFSESDTLYAGLYNCGVMSCNALTGEVGHAIIPGTGLIVGLSLSKSLICFH